MNNDIYFGQYLRGIIILLCLILLPVGCERTEPGPINQHEIGELFEKNEYNLDMQDFSLAVTSSIRENAGFRNLIKDEALKMFDGDYDVLLSAIINKEVTADQSSVKSGKGIYSVRDLLQSHFERTNKIDDKKSSASPIDDLIAKYPYLQISVPVNAEDWDVNNYDPLVTFIPYEFDELTTKEVIAYTSSGESIALDAVNPPEEPVIVICMNERIEIVNEAILPDVPPTPYNLKGILTESGIRINWEMRDTASVDNTTGFFIYRKSSSDLDYIKLSTISGAYNRSYDDNYVVSSKVYSYYVIAYYQGKTSSPSNYVTITAPQDPKPVLAFDAIQHAKNEVELRWQNDNSQYILETKIYKHVVGITPDYEFFKSFTSGQHDYFDTDIAVGRKIIYKVTHANALGESNPKYDFIMAPYRDISQGSPVYIKQIKFSSWKIEGWLAGKPEFYITVTNVDPEKKNPFKVQDQIICKFSKRSSTSQVFVGKKVFDWQPGFWYDMLTFTVLEYDRPSREFKLKIGVGFNAKDPLKLGLLQASAGVEYEINFQNKGEEGGNSYLNYFDNPETWLVFPNYGVQVLVSENDN